MSSQHSLSIRTRDDQAPSGRFYLLPVLLGIVVTAFVLAALVTMHVVGRLDAMSTSLNQVRSGLENLSTMNQKLDRLSGMSRALRQVDDELTVTNRLLVGSNQQQARMSADSRAAGASLSGMRHTLSVMREDIHVMSRKLSGSFLFRSVK